MDSGLIRAKPLLLKDYLLDDLSSCSSSGFKSLPRRQCCTTVRFIHEFDRKNKHQKKKQLDFNKTPPTKSAIAAFQSVVTAVKRLPFPAAKSPEKSRSGTTNSFLSRSFSKKIFKKSSFWKKKTTVTTTAEKREIGRWKSFDELLKEDPSPSDRITTSEDQSGSWSGIDFTTVPTENCLSGNSISPAEGNSNLQDSRNDAVQEENKADRANMVLATNDDVSVNSTTCSDGSAGTKSSTNKDEQKQWGSEEKEQFSPVSVLECPFDDDDEVSSPFQHRLARMEGTKKKLMKKIQMFECLAKFEPVNLSSRFASHSSSSTDEKPTSDVEESEEEEEERNEAEQKVLELFHRTKANSSSYNLKLKADKLLLDFFRENITNHEREITREKRSSELLETAREWIDGVEPRSSVVEWGVKKNREAYVKEMEKGGAWKTLEHENNVVALELENEVYSTLLHELVLDMASAN